ncbi:uncharacterized protein TNCV_4127441 [Trichonephila clavipes]|uniref:Uncharacterized protein n=1 Tax=Trichonephila clavipes TaxID=2585209 RepID=A0A8X6VHZ1_TRICX|nr:uncharacterized protein TNCV_4127441 [Trichonephila clavipes]
MSGANVTVRHFYSKHVAQKYNLDCRKQCLFCFGKKHWPYGQKNRPENVNHVTECLQRFVEDAKIHEETEEEETEEEEVVCGCRHFRPVPRGMRGRHKDRLSEYVGFYNSLLEKPEMWEEGVTFQNGFRKDVWGIVQLYLRQDLMWFHIMVKHDVFDTFRKEMEKIRDQCVILPFWYLCDGLVNEKGKIQHRHMILACEQESVFEDVLKGKGRYKFPNSGRVKKCIKIKNAFHLVRTIMYVSQPKSSCDKDEIPENLMDSQLGNKNVSSWVKVAKHVPDPWYNARWEVPIHVTGWKFLHCVIPLHPRDEEELYLHLYGNKKWHLKDYECSFQRIRDEMYVLSCKQQNTMKETKKVKTEWAMDQKVILKAKLNEMRAINDLIRRENDVLKTKEQEWKTKENELNSKLQGMSREIKILKKALQGRRVDRISSNPWR